MGLSAMFFLNGSLRFGFWLASFLLRASPPAVGKGRVSPLTRLD